MFLFVNIIAGLLLATSLVRRFPVCYCRAYALVKFCLKKVHYERIFRDFFFFFIYILTIQQAEDSNEIAVVDATKM